MIKTKSFVLSFAVKDPKAAFEFYKSAFGAVKSEEQPGEPVLMMEIDGYKILLAQGDERPIDDRVWCCINFDSEEELRKSYEVLIQEGRDYSVSSYPFARVGATVTDKYGVGWWLSAD